MENAENKTTAAERDREFAALLRRRILEHAERAEAIARTLTEGQRKTEELRKEKLNGYARKYVDAHRDKVREYQRKYHASLPPEKKREYEERRMAKRRARRAAAEAASDGKCQKVYEHCAEIPEKPKPRRATRREFAKWLAQGNGEYRTKADDEHRYTFQYNEVMENEEIESYIVVRKWGDTEWHEPTVDYMSGEAER